MCLAVSQSRPFFGHLPTQMGKGTGKFYVPFHILRVTCGFAVGNMEHGKLW